MTVLVRAPRRLGRWLLLGVVLLVAIGVTLSARRRASVGASRGDRAGSATAARLVPEGTRIRVEVLNASEMRGLARRATFLLRDAGFDVVYFGNTTARSESTVVLDRSGHADWAALAAKAVGGGRVDTQLDSSRYLDLTVLIGSRWTPPGEPLYP